MTLNSCDTAIPQLQTTRANLQCSNAVSRKTKYLNYMWLLRGPLTADTVYSWFCWKVCGRLIDEFDLFQQLEMETLRCCDRLCRQQGAFSRDGCPSVELLG